MRAFVFVVVALAALGSMPAGAACYDLSKGEPHSLTGRLDYTVYPGPPNYEDVRKGDRPEAFYVLVLDAPICLAGDPDFADPKLRFNRVQLVGTDKVRPVLAKLRDQRVVVQLTSPMAAFTGHHHEPLLAQPVDIRLATRDDR